MSSGVGLSEGSEWEKRCKLDWRQQREQARGQLVRKYDHSEARNYDTMVGTLAEADECAYLADVLEAVALVAGQSVLDVGAGTGALAKYSRESKGSKLPHWNPHRQCANCCAASQNCRGYRSWKRLRSRRG